MAWPLHHSLELSLQHPCRPLYSIPVGEPGFGNGDIPSCDTLRVGQCQSPVLPGGWQGADTGKPGTFSWRSHAALQFVITCRGGFRSYL